MDRRTVFAAGDLDFDALDPLRAGIEQAIPAAPDRLVVDLSQAGFTGAALMGLLSVSAHRLAESGGALEVAGAGDVTRRIMRLCGLAHLIVDGRD